MTAVSGNEGKEDIQGGGRLVPASAFCFADDKLSTFRKKQVDDLKGKWYDPRDRNEGREQG